MRATIKVYGELKLYISHGKNEFIWDFEQPKRLAEILGETQVPLEYIGVITVDGITANLETWVFQDAQIKVYPMVSGG